MNAAGTLTVQAILTAVMKPSNKTVSTCCLLLKSPTTRLTAELSSPSLEGFVLFLLIYFFLELVSS